MTAVVINEDMKVEIEKFLKANRAAGLISVYLLYLEGKLGLQPVVVPAVRTIYESCEAAINILEKEGKLWHETEIKVSFSQAAVNKDTKKIYICPFSGKVFGDNTHPNPQDAIYDWVAKCPENKERSGGLPVKRFFVSEDPEVIKNYIEERKETITKVVYSSVITGKLFNTREAVLEDFRRNQQKPYSLVSALGQNRFQIEAGFLAFIQGRLEEGYVTAFVDGLRKYPEFAPYIKFWSEEAEGEAAEAEQS